MFGINTCTFIGRVSRGPDAREYDKDGTPAILARFDLEVTTGWRVDGATRTHVEYVQVAAWDEAAERVLRCVEKGDYLFVEGRMRSDVWKKQIGEVGVRMRTTCIMARRIRVLAQHKRDRLKPFVDESEWTDRAGVNEPHGRSDARTWTNDSDCRSEEEPRR